MVDLNLMGELELIEIKQRSVNRNRGCSISSTKTHFMISKRIGEELKWRNNERVNLYHIGNTFVLKADKVGLLTVKATNGGYRINSAGLCLELLSRTKSCRKYEAWTEQGMLMFKPERSEEDE